MAKLKCSNCIARETCLNLNLLSVSCKKIKEIVNFTKLRAANEIKSPINVDKDNGSAIYRFEWNYDHIKSQKDFDEFVNEMKKEDNKYFSILANYEQLARLFYEDGKGNSVMIELQVPTVEFFEMVEDDTEIPWLDAYEVKNLYDYDTRYEMYSEIGQGIVLTYENAEEEMLRLAKEVCEECFK